MKRIRRTPRGNRCDKSLDSQGILLFVLKRGKIAIFRQPLFVSLYISLQNAFTNMENLRILPHQLPAPGYNLSVKEFPILYAPHFGLWDLTTKTYLPLWQEIIYRSFLSFIILHFNIYIPYLHTKRKPYLIQKWLMDAVIFAMI